MSPKPFPKAPEPVELHECMPYTSTDQGWNTSPTPSTTACKHGLGDCEQCGTTNRRDARHKTRGGVGVVGRLFR